MRNQVDGRSVLELPNHYVHKSVERKSSDSNDRWRSHEGHKHLEERGKSSDIKVQTIVEDDDES